MKTYLECIAMVVWNEMSAIDPGLQTFSPQLVMLSQGGIEPLGYGIFLEEIRRWGRL